MVQLSWRYLVRLFRHSPWLMVLLLGTSLAAQQTPTMQPQQAPQTSPQTEQALPSFEGQKVTSVELAGQPTLDKRPYLPLLVQHAGEPFSQAKIEASAAALRQTGKFQAVDIQILPEASGVRVLFVLQPAMYFGIFRFPGVVSHFPYSRLLQVTNYPPRGNTYSDIDVTDARDALLSFLNHSGYFLAQVRPELQIDKNLGVVNVVYNVTLGPRAKFGRAIVRGAPPKEADELSGALQSIWARLHTSAIRRGKTFKRNTVTNATQYLENDLTGDGYLAAQVELAGTQYHPATNQADVLFNITPGPIVHLKVQGVFLWPWAKPNLFPPLQQAGVNQELIQEGKQNLLSYLQKKGYFKAQVDTKIEHQDSAETILYQVNKGPRKDVEEVSIVGNHHFSEKDLMAHVTVSKENFFFFSHGDYSDKLVRESVSNLKNMYQADGFSAVSITPVVKPDDNGNLDVTFRVNEGPQDTVAALHLDGNHSLSQQQLAPKGLKLRAGQPYSQNNATQDRNQIMAQYLNRGYLTATFRETAQPAPGQQHQVIVTYKIHEGPQVHTADVITLGRDGTKQQLIARDTSAITTGKPLREQDMLRTASDLYTSGVFDWAEVDPRRHITTQTKEDVVVKVHEAKRNTVTYGLGFEVINRGGNIPSGTVALPNLPPVGLPSKFTTSQKTFWGPRGTFDYTRNNLRGKGESLTFAGLAGRLDQRGSVTYIDPSFRWTHWAANASVTGEHDSENPIFTSRLADVGFQLQRSLNPDKTQNLFLRYGFRETGLTRLLIPQLVPPEDLHVRLSTFAGTYVRDTRDNPLDAHQGIYESFETSISPSALGSSDDFAKLLAQGAYYKKIGLGVIWANSLRIGLAKPFVGSHVPVSEKFFSGGGSTLRGFPLNGAGPQQTIAVNLNGGSSCAPNTPDCSLIQVPTGGDQLLIVNSEFRIPLSFLLHNLGVAAFYDGGNVFRSIGFHGQYTNTLGGGLRYHTPVGPIRFDVGYNLNAPPGISSIQYFVTLGQAF